MAMKIISVTDIKGFRLGNAENSEKGTGCTVIVCEEGAVGGVDVRGGGPATRETDLLKSENTVNSVNAVVLSGGSAFGLESASGVMRELADKGVGFNVIDDIHVPIVCGASLFDLPLGDSKAFPDIYMGMQAVRNAYDGHFARGNHGAGTGATVGKLKGYDRAMKSGLGAFACGDGVIEVGAVAAVNAVGDIYNGAGNIIAGLRSEDGKSIFGTIKTLKGMVHDKVILDDNTSFISRNEIEEALAAAARQYEEEADVEAANEEAIDEPAEPVIIEPAEAIEEPAAEAADETPEENAEGFTEEPAEEVTEEIAEEPVDEPFEEEAEETAEEITEEPVEEPVEEESEENAEEIIEAIDDGSAETIEGPAEEAAEEQEEEFIPETPKADISAESFRGYDEISIPAADASPADDTAEEATEEPVEEPAEATAVETPEETAEVATEESVEEPAEAAAVETPEEIAEEFAEEPAEEAAEVSTDEPAAEEIIAATEDGAEEFTEETPEDVPEETVEAFVDEPAEEITEEEDRPVLTREEMGYDIVFNTTISCLITNAALTKSQANKLASILHDAYARAIKPVHGTLDGDTVFVLCTGKQEVNFDAFAALATDVMQYAIIDGAMSAEGAYGLPAAKDMQK